jgi:DNA-binding GntR family transcriptional regulator
MALSEDTELQVVEPLHVLASVEIAEQLQAGADTVMTMSFLRLHEAVPFCYTRVHLPMQVGRGLRELPEVAVNHFHPDRYSYRIQLRTRLDHSAAPPAGSGSR